MALVVPEVPVVLLTGRSSVPPDTVSCMPKHSSSYDNPSDDWGDPGHSAGQNYGNVPPSYRLPGTRGGDSPIYRAPAAPAGGSKSKISLSFWRCSWGRSGPTISISAKRARE